MNYKLEKFWNELKQAKNLLDENMNYKLEKFWNFFCASCCAISISMNYKLEKFKIQNLLSFSFIDS